ncbi:MAG: DUF2807 domain-containing protein [Alistipes sp.]|jgi:hypothetical protein|nr:DUF2807 domain-containing protein [Alistipes sp.]
MKKIILTLISVTLILPAVLRAQSVSTKTSFEGERITGVSASSAFNVVLVKSIQTRAVLEVNSELESHVRISRSADGVVSVDLNDMGHREWRLFSRMSDKDRLMRLTLYLPSVNTIRLSGATSLISSDAFTGDEVDIQLSGASNIRNPLSIASQRLKIQCSGASNASLLLPTTRDLVVVASGASHVKISAKGVANSKLGASGASHVEIVGDGTTGNWSASGASKITGDEFAAKDVSIIVSGASSARVNASGTLTTRTSGASSVRYAGSPAHIHNESSTVRPLK